MYCKHCGKEIPDGAAFCPTCGKSRGEDKAATGKFHGTKKEINRYLLRKYPFKYYVIICIMVGVQILLQFFPFISVGLADMSDYTYSGFDSIGLCLSILNNTPTLNDAFSMLLIGRDVWRLFFLFFELVFIFAQAFDIFLYRVNNKNERKNGSTFFVDPIIYAVIILINLLVCDAGTYMKAEICFWMALLVQIGIACLTVPERFTVWKTCQKIKRGGYVIIPDAAEPAREDSQNET